MAAQQVGDTASYQDASRSITRRFGNHGARVLQDVLEVMGDSRFSAQIQAQAASQDVAGQRPTQQLQQQVRIAERTNQMNRAANGSAPSAGQMTDDQLRAALGASPL